MPLSDGQIERIAAHTFDKPLRVHRFNTEKYGPPLNIATTDDLVAAINVAVRSPTTEHVARAEGGYLIRNPETNLTVLADGLGGGTSYRDNAFEKDFIRLINQENGVRKERELAPAEKMIGPVPLERDVARERAREAINSAGNQHVREEARSRAEQAAMLRLERSAEAKRAMEHMSEKQRTEFLEMLIEEERNKLEQNQAEELGKRAAQAEEEGLKER